MDERALERAAAETVNAYAEIELSVARGEARGNGNEAFQKLSQLLVALGLDRVSHPERIDASSLTLLQRRVLTTLLHHGVALGGVFGNALANLPRSWWQQRVWLGLASPGILDRTWGECWPLDRNAAVKAFPESLRAEAGIELLLSGDSIGSWFYEELSRTGAHALDYATATLHALRRDENALARVALFSVFVQAKQVVPEGADTLFPLAYKLPDESPALAVSTRFLVEQLSAVHPVRRDDVLTSSMVRVHQGNYQAAMHLLEHQRELLPLPKATGALEAYLQRSKEKRTTTVEKKSLADLARRLKAAKALLKSEGTSSC